jgi:hypothetical protein
MFTPELLSLLGGGVAGFIFRHMAEKRQAEKEMFERLMQANIQTTENQNQAAQRVSVDAGKVTRRFIVLMVLFGTILAPFILPFFNIPTVVEVIQDKPEWLFGLIPATKEVLFQEINGYLFTQENRQVLVSIIGFYFGGAAAANKT